MNHLFNPAYSSEPSSSVHIFHPEQTVYPEMSTDTPSFYNLSEFKNPSEKQLEITHLLFGQVIIGVQQLTLSILVGAPFTSKYPNAYFVPY